MSNFIPIEPHLYARGYSIIAGIDEAGRGPLAGPVVSAAVILKKDTIIEGLNDSKKLTAKKREQLFPQILENCLDYAISFVSHQTIDRINILNATRLANKLCIKSLKIKPDIILIDGRDKQFLKSPFLTLKKGDLKMKSIAAASVLAKVFRDKIMEYYHKKLPEYGFHQHKGYGTRKHSSNIKEFGLSEIHRKSYNLKK